MPPYSLGGTLYHALTGHVPFEAETIEDVVSSHVHTPLTPPIQVNPQITHPTNEAIITAMAKNPFMKVFVASGYFDMATPYYAAEYTISAMNLDPQLRRNISVSYYEAGHMMYIEKNSLRKLKDDVTVFIKNATSR